MSTPLVAILMGSKNDLPTMEATEKVLDSLSIPYETHVMSAHRNPEKVHAYAKGARDAGIEVFICAAGGAAALPGAVSALTTLPVIGVPLATSEVAGGIDAIYAVLQIPPGVPVAGVGVGGWGTRNAAYLAASILSLSHDDIRESYTAFREQQSR